MECFFGRLWMYMHVFSDNRDTSCVLGDNDGHRAIHYDQIIKRSFGRRARRCKERLGNLGSCFQATGMNQELLRSVDGAERGVGHDWPFTIQTYARNALNNFSILVYKAATTSAKRSIGCMNGTGGIQSSTIDIGNGEAVWHKRWFDICHETEQGVGHDWPFTKQTYARIVLGEMENLHRSGTTAASCPAASAAPPDLDSNAAAFPPVDGAVSANRD